MYIIFIYLPKPVLVYHEEKLIEQDLTENLLSKKGYHSRNQHECQIVICSAAYIFVKINRHKCPTVDDSVSRKCRLRV